MDNNDIHLPPINWTERYKMVAPVEHELKVWPQYFIPTRAGLKPFELRKADRDFKVGDVLFLREYDPNKDAYTGRSLRQTVTCVVSGAPWLAEGYVCLGLAAK